MARKQWRTLFDTRTEAMATIGVLHPTRRHSALAFRSPIQYETMALAAGTGLLTLKRTISCRCPPARECEHDVGRGCDGEGEEL